MLCLRLAPGLSSVPSTKHFITVGDTGRPSPTHYMLNALKNLYTVEGAEDF